MEAQHLRYVRSLMAGANSNFESVTGLNGADAAPREHTPGHVPFANLFYLKSSFDCLAAYHLFEAMKPGWYRRTNEMMKKQQGRTMIGYKPYAPIQFYTCRHNSVLATDASS